MIDQSDKVQVSALLALVCLLWFIGGSRTVWALAGCIVGASLHSQYQKYRVQVRLFEWKIRCRVKHWFESLFNHPQQRPKVPGPRHIPKPHIDS